jgi:3-dehydroquinate synthase
MGSDVSGRILHVELKERTYPIVIGSGTLAEVGAYIAPMIDGGRCFVMTDGNVAERHLRLLIAKLDAAGVRAVPFIVRAGEQSKSLAVVERALGAFLAEKPDRRMPVIALGGGVVGDLAGFVASVLLRGVPFFQIPTTLLSQVDSSVGGKTGVNTVQGKNLVGTFYQPKCVLIDVDVLATLPEREMRAGYAEVVKYGMIASADFFAWLQDNGRDVCAADAEKCVHAVATSCGIKARIVAEDEKETGVRAHLNFGHTFAHAYEAICGYDGTLLHGEAVAFGMVMAADLSLRLGVAKDVKVKRDLKEHLASCGLPTDPSLYAKDVNPRTVLDYMGHDKKVQGDRLRFVLLKNIGTAAMRYVDDRDALLDLISSYSS